MTSTKHEVDALPGMLSVSKALAGKRVLLTGTTGFLAKVVLEKLLREISDVSRIILLLRGGKHGVSARERFEREIAASSIFDRLRSERGEWLQAFFTDRVECVTAEIAEPCFGLSAARFAALSTQVDVVINAAASVHFREPLDEALRINALSLQHLTSLARAADVPLIQISTCYVNGYLQGDIHEAVTRSNGAVIPRHRDGYHEVDAVIHKLQQKIARIQRTVHDPQLRERRLTELGIREANRYGWNDTYTFTKWLGEQLALRGMQGHTLTVLRPAIIESTLQEPVAGWIEGVKVADAIILAYARGKTRFFPAVPNEIIDIIPADLVANSILLATAEAMTETGRHHIYQCCSGAGNPIRLGEVIRLLQEEAKRHWQRYDRLFYRAPTHDFRIVHHRTFHLMLGAMRAGAAVADMMHRLTGGRGRRGDLATLDAVRTTRLLALTFSFYTRPRYRFHNSKLLALAKRFGGDELARFPVDATLINWQDYLCNIHLPGLNRYALRRKETVAAEPVAPVTVATAEFAG